MTANRTDTPPIGTSADLVKEGKATAYFKRWLDVMWTRTGGFHDLSAIVSDAASASPPNAYIAISNDLGVTYTPSATTATLIATFYNLQGTVIATQAVLGTRVNATGNWTLTPSTATGAAVTLSYLNNGTQVAAATARLGNARTTLTFTSQIDNTALGSFSGGISK